jgi:ubiquitin-conjugating enzyme E2 variant
LLDWIPFVGRAAVQVFKPATLPAAAVLAVSPWLPLTMHTFLPSFLFLACMSQQFHAWSHMKKSELHPAVVMLQDANILISRKGHGAHHRPDFEGNYSIVSGWWNPLLDSSGFFRRLEAAVFSLTGVEPRCWYPPNNDWAEQVQPGQAAVQAEQS